MPDAIETEGAWDIQTIEFIEELGKRITAVTNGLVSENLHYHTRGNEVSFLNTFSEDQLSHFNHTIFPN